MKAAEFSAILKRLKLSEAHLLRLVGASDKTKISKDQARCLRALALHEDIRDLVLRARAEWPHVVFTGVRALDDKR